GLTLPIALDPTLRIRGGMERAAAHAEILVSDTAGDIVAAAELGQTAAIDRAIRSELRGQSSGGRFPADGGTPGPSADPEPPSAGGEAPAEDGAGGHRVVYLGTARVGGGPLARALPGRTETFTTQFRYQEEGEA